MNNETALSGMKEITEYCAQIGLARTDDRVHQLRQQEGLPMAKIGGIWESDRDAIRDWRRDRIRKSLGLADDPLAAAKKKVKPRKKRKKVATA